jgi:hypothetical protein
MANPTEIQDRPLSEVERLCIERDYLLQRASKAGTVSFSAGRDTGISSNALVAFAITGVEPGEDQYPRDPADLAACYNAQRGAPAHLQARMQPLIEKYRARVAERYPSVLEEGTGTEHAPKAQEGMPIDEFLSRLGEFVQDDASAGTQKPAEPEVRRSRRR